VAAVVTDSKFPEEVSKALTRNGFRPGVDEFKSSMRMDENPSARSLRDDLRHIIALKSKLAVVVCARSERRQAPQMCVDLLSALVETGAVTTPALASLDQGLTVTAPEILGLTLDVECDSKEVVGIQVADCAAAIISRMILAEMGMDQKTILVEDYPSYVAIELAWSLWRSVRFAMSSGKPILGDIEEPDMEPFGLFVSPGCSPKVRRAAMARLGHVWVGCTL